MRESKSQSKVKMVVLAACLLGLGGCAAAAMQLFMEGQTAIQRGDYPTGVMKLEEALRAEPTSTIIQNALNQAKNSWASEILKESDQIPSTDLDNKLAKVKKAGELAPENPFVVQKVREVDTLANEVRAKAATVMALADEGNYPGAQTILSDIKKYTLSEVESSGSLLKNSIEAHDKVSKLEVKQTSLFSSYRELLQTQKTEPLAKKVKGLIADKLGTFRSKLNDELVAKIESDKKLSSPKLSTKLAQFYKDALSERGGEFPPIEAAVERIGVGPVPIGVYSIAKRTITNRLRVGLETAGLSKDGFNVVLLPPRPLRDDLDKLELVLVLKDVQQKVVEQGRDTPQERMSEYIYSYRKVANPEYRSAVQNYQAAQLEYSRLQSQLNTIGGLIVFGAAAAAAKERLDQATKVLQSTPQYIDEPVKSPYRYQEYNISLQMRFQGGYQLIDSQQGVVRKAEKFEVAKEEHWQELDRVHAKDAAGLQNFRRDRGYQERLQREFEEEAIEKLCEEILGKILSTLRSRIKNLGDQGDIDAAMEEKIRLMKILRHLKKRIEKEIYDFITGNLLKKQSTPSEIIKTVPQVIPWSEILVDKRFSLKEIEDLLRNGVLPKRVGALAEDRGINFEVTSQERARLKKAGADNELIERLERL